MSTFELACEHCQSRYLVPLELRERLRGQPVVCAWCTKEWTPLPIDARDLNARGRGDGFGQQRLSLHPYLQANLLSAPQGPATLETPVVRSTTQLVRASAGGVRTGLRVAAAGPEFELKTVYDLGDKSFLVGRRGCHLDLPKASGLPERAFRVRADADGGFVFEGIEGFLVPVGDQWLASGRIEPDARLDLILSPYRVAFKASATPGLPIPDLERPEELRAAVAAAKAAPPAVDLSQTVRDYAALGLDARRSSDPLDALDVGLMHVDPPLQGETLWITKSPTLVGRTAGDLLLVDPRVSGKHAQIDVLGVDQYSIKDLASTNGTTVNDRPASTVRLKDGDIVGFGGVRLQFVARPKRR